MRTITLIVGTAAALAGAATTVPFAARDAATQTAPERAVSIAAPAQFDHPRPNPYFPLQPGTVTRYRAATRANSSARRSRSPTGPRRSRASRTPWSATCCAGPTGRSPRRPDDWYAADNDGNVWYFGEATATYDEQRPPGQPGGIVAGRAARRRGRA